MREEENCVMNWAWREGGVAGKDESGLHAAIQTAVDPASGGRESVQFASNVKPTKQPLKTQDIAANSERVR